MALGDWKREASAAIAARVGGEGGPVQPLQRRENGREEEHPE